MKKKLILSLAAISGLLLLTNMSFGAPLQQGCTITGTENGCQIDLKYGYDTARVTFINFNAPAGAAKVTCDYTTVNEKFNNTASTGADGDFSKGSVSTASSQITALLKKPSTKTISGYLDFGVQSTDLLPGGSHHVTIKNCSAK